MGTVKTVNLIVNGTLTVTGTLLQRHDGATGLNINATIAGSGTINCNNLHRGEFKMRTKILINKTQLLKLVLLCLVLTLQTMAIVQDDLPCCGGAT
ncbi:MULTISPECIES: hypothetical protein [unclassified Mucilaginibacter]|uniref:hypothetical protein n=1 Tax=unclassified Mucilaginibacter TaxID=2617802 RepID=UPI002AC902EA|nr:MULTISPECIES: hypothetical protein [unclassified Mucilaginibacter]MEB0263325.1 hypothetical protein [Mucilaginibacter sp. 10I4]MEB0280729.1 hypothetical protein [Mucilaginibacter sp. 10B2]MEB0301446.1 hypothetical protein [Mucilaginibacter sp. 5C4]WPX22682.1 hypothetical protein RHM67_15475 [Mucilaginibacter sp. 5C4]